jgi:hypothetical protein
MDSLNAQNQLIISFFETFDFPQKGFSEKRQG